MRLLVVIGLLFGLEPDNLCNASEDATVSLAMSTIFDGTVLQDNVRTVCQTAATHSVQARFELLADWVVPNDERTTFRLKGKFNPSSAVLSNLQDAPGVAVTTTSKHNALLSPIGFITSPALDLLEAAEQAGQLNSLRDRIAAVPAANINDKRSRAAMLFLVETTRDDMQTAGAAFDGLIALSDEASRTQAEARWPELLTLWVGVPNPKTRKMVSEFFSSVYVNLDPYIYDSELDVMNDYVRALSGLNLYLAEGQNDITQFGTLRPSDQFVEFSYADAETRGHGRPRAHWEILNGAATKWSGHEQDYLSFRSPLQGNYAIECDCSTGDGVNTALMVAGYHVEISGQSTLQTGSFRKHIDTVTLTPDLTKFQDVLRHRAVVRDGVLRHYVNGRLVLEQQLPPHHDPWTALRSWRRSRPQMRSFRITGAPTIPDAINLTGDSRLGSWTQYFGENFGSTMVKWQPLMEDANTVGMIAPCVTEQHGEIVEELLQIGRPMLEDGTIEYEFFYEPGQFIVHPALDRLCFLLEPDGVRMHLLTDGKFDESPLPPDNMFDEPDCRRGPGKLPLNKKSWNKLRLTLTGKTVTLHLNGAAIYERQVELTNSLNFGFFHFADQASAKVRNVIWRGAWPKQLPSIAEQQLARSDADSLDETAPKLSAQFYHDFRKGFPNELFDVLGDETKLHQIEDGIRTSRVADVGIQEIRACLQVHGDYDIVATFKDLKLITPAPPGKTGIGLMTFLDNLTQDSSALYRRAGENGGQHRTHFAHKAVQEDGDIKYSGQGLVEESLSGQLRLARRGNTVYGLYGEDDSPNFRLLFQQQVPPDDVAPQGLRLVMQSERKLPVEVTWCDLSVRAERISGLPIENPELIIAALNERRAARTGTVIDFTDAASVDENFTMPENSSLFRKHETDGMRITVPGTGRQEAAVFYGRFGAGPEFDIETQLKVHDITLPAQLGKHSEIIMELNLASDDPNDVSNPIKATFILRQKSNDIRKLIARLVAKDRVGQTRYVPLRAMEIKSPDKLRIAVLNQKIYFLFSTTDSEADQVVAEFPIDRSTYVTNVELWAFPSGAGRMIDLTWQKLTTQGSVTLP